MASGALPAPQPANQQAQSQAVRGQLLQAQYQKHKQFNQTTTGNMNNGNVNLG